MLIRNACMVISLFLLASCFEPKRECAAFKDGTFTFTSEIGGESKTSTFIRAGTMEIDYFDAKSDTASVRWINDCEYILKKLHPQNIDEEQAVHMKILSTTETSYTFEYSILGDSKKLRGTATRIPAEDTGVDNTN